MSDPRDSIHRMTRVQAVEVCYSTTRPIVVDELTCWVLVDEVSASAARWREQADRSE